MNKANEASSIPRSKDCECNYNNNYYGDQVCLTVNRSKS